MIISSWQIKLDLHVSLLCSCSVRLLCDTLHAAGRPRHLHGRVSWQAPPCQRARVHLCDCPSRTHLVRYVVDCLWKNATRLRQRRDQIQIDGRWSAVSDAAARMYGSRFSS